MKPKFFLSLLAAVCGLLLAGAVLSSAHIARAELGNLGLGYRPEDAAGAPRLGFLAVQAPLTVSLEVDPGGDIDLGALAEWDGVYENTSGAFAWSGYEWTTNNTLQHTYYSDTVTHQRFYSHTLDASFDGSTAPGVTDILGGLEGVVTQTVYSYAIPSKLAGNYRYQAVEYRVLLPALGRLILRSRGCGRGLSTASFDIYIQEPYAGLAVTAIRGDPRLYKYNTTLEQAPLITDETQGLIASLPSSVPARRARYWFDVQGGSDMNGYSYMLKTQALDCLTRNLGSSFPVEFQILYYLPGDNLVHEIHFLPRLLSETPPNLVFLPLVRRR
jgi:hypothetical protein